MAKFFYVVNRLVFSCDIPETVIIGKRLRLPHFGLGVVIHPDSVIGDNVKIYQQVTIGARNDCWKCVVGNNVIIGSGAKILGNVNIGNSAKIGANAVVLDDVPDNTIAVGVPARIVGVG